jgi:SpoVK/Ycf46/Vps4 family AAA+-type ATPase
MVVESIRELILHLEARYPLIFLMTGEENRALVALEDAASKAGRRLIRARQLGGAVDLEKALASCDSEESVLVLDSVHRNMNDPNVIRLLADFARIGSNAPGGTAVILAPWAEVPVELTRMSAMLELSLPTPDELMEVLNGECAQLGVLQTEDDGKALVRVGQGLEMEEAARAFRKAMIGWPTDAAGARRSVESDKRRALRRSNVLEHVEAPKNMEDVGGLDQLKSWLDSRAGAFSKRARDFGLPAPRGLLLMGIQGCGKSLASKAVAGFWRLPLVRLDLSAVFGQPHPEEALRQALKVAEAMSPMVLWIDEIEKGFDNKGEGPAARILGGMVTWLQEKQHEVFVVATANRVEALPPELPRKGRFDEIFFVDLPNRHERQEILSLHLAMRGLDPERYNLKNLAELTKKFTGSELEQLVISSMYFAFGREEKPNDADLEHARRETVPLYDTFEPEIKKLREWARKRARPASTDRRKIDMFSDKKKEGNAPP